MTLYVTMFIAGLLTILLPCILPLIPIVLGVSIVGRSRWRPVLTVLGMVVSFVGFSFLLLVVLNQFVEFADYIRLATYYILVLFGIGFLTHSRPVQLLGALVGSAFFLSKGWFAVVIGVVPTTGVPPWLSVAVMLVVPAARVVPLPVGPMLATALKLDAH